jgi:hypothetical protein
MLSDIVKDYLEGRCTSIVSSSGGGATSLTLYLANIIFREDKSVLYFNPTEEIDRSFVKKYYPRVFSKALFAITDLEEFIELISSEEIRFDWTFIDPGDMLITRNKKILDYIISLCSLRRSSLVCTSQIRVVPETKQVYSTIEQTGLFNYNIWIRKIGLIKDDLIDEKYVDVFPTVHQGNNFIARYVMKITPGGQIME